MQTSDIKEGGASAPQAKPLAARMKAVLKWCDKRGIKQVYSFFYGCDNALSEYETRIRLVLRTSTHTVVDADEPWVESMELTINAVNNRKSAA